MARHAVLTIKVVYHGEEAEPDAGRIAETLHAAANHLAGEGMLSGNDTDLLVDTWSSEVEVLP